MDWVISRNNICNPIWNNKTNKISNQSAVRPANGENFNKNAWDLVDDLANDSPRYHGAILLNLLQFAAIKDINCN